MEGSVWLEIIISFFLLAGAFFALVGSIGLLRFPGFYMRLHGPTKATTLGVGGILTASILYFTFMESGFSFQEVLVTLFLFMTAPVSAHLVSKATLHLGVDDVQGEIAEQRESEPTRKYIEKAEFEDAEKI